MLKEFLNSKRVWITLAGVALLLLADAVRSQGVEIAPTTIDRALGMLALLMGADAYKPLGRPRDPASEVAMIAGLDVDGAAE